MDFKFFKLYIIFYGRYWLFYRRFMRITNAIMLVTWFFGLKDGRCAEVDDILPDGFRMKKGDGLYYMAYAMGRMPYIWGEDAEDFRPERWLNNGIFQPESPFKFIAFHVSIFSSFVADITCETISIVVGCSLAGRSSDMSGQRLRVPADEDTINSPSSVLPLQIS